MKKTIKFSSIILFALALLVGCNNDLINETQENTNAQNTAYRQRNVMDNDRIRDNAGIRNIGTQAEGNAPAAEVQEINHGYITIDPNSFSTSTPSEKFPHSKMIEQKGPYAIFKFQEKHFQGQPEGRAPQGQAPQGGAPEGPVPQEEAPQGQAPETRQAPTEEQPAEQGGGEEQQQAQETPEGITETEMKVVELTNAERRKNGLSDLQADASLSNVARDKSKDMQTNNYFSHNSPTHGSPFDMMRDYGVNYNTAGENIAMGQRSPEEVVNAWMNSEGHRKNILNGEFTHIGVGYVEEGNYWTQMFIGK